MFNRRRSDIASTEIEPIEVIESGKIPAVVQAAHRHSLRQLKKKLPLSPNPLITGTYEVLHRFDLSGDLVEVGRVGEDSLPLTKRQMEHFFAAANLVGKIGTVNSHVYLDRAGRFRETGFQIDNTPHDSVLVFAPEQRIVFRNKVGSALFAYSTGLPHLKPEETAVSFVGISQNISSETRMATATEITQNRTRVVGLTALSIPSGRFDAFQESVANGLGNAFGHIAEGKTYKEYEKYVRGEYAQTAPLGGHEDGIGGMIVAPHLLAPKAFYESVADGEMPSAKQLDFTPVLPR